MYRNSLVALAAVFLPVLAALPLPARAAGDTPGAGIEAVSLEAYPTFNCIGLRVPYKGDTDSNAVARVRFREKGAGAWRPALDLARIKDNRFAGSLFFLSSGTAYEVEVQLEDAGGVAGVKTAATVTTRPENFPSGSGRTWCVSLEGDDRAAGTPEKPLRTIAAAAVRVQPGDVVRVAPGVYREEVKITRSGRKDAYIRFVADGAGVILSGADPAYDRIPAAKPWKDEGGGVYSTDPGYATRFLAADEIRLYHYRTREEFDEFICDAPGGWFQDKATGQLYLKLVSGADPNRIAVQIASLDAGFHLSGADCVLIEGFEVRDYGRNTGGSGIRVEQSAWNVIRRCAVYGMQSQVELAGRRAEGNLVEGCELRDSSIPLWPWQMTKSHDEEGSGVMSTGGRGNVVRGCTIHDLFDGLAPSYWDSLWNEAYNCDWDVHGNEIYNTRDDIIEPEGPCINFRFWNNVCHSLFVGVSLAPINVGPTYVLYNLIYDLQFKNFKYGGSDPGWCYILHNTVCSINRGHDLMVISQPLKGQIYRNNILWATGWAMWSSRKPLVAENDLDYDCWYSSDIDWFRGYTGLAHKRLFRFEGREYFFIKDFTEAFGWEKHGLQAHPRLADPGSGDFRLLPDSPCLDRGVVLPNINDRFVGAGPDLGAFERGSANRSRFPLGEVR